MLPLLLGLAILGFGLYFLSLFFQFQKVERKLDEALKDVEVFMLREFGEVSPDSILEGQEQRPESPKKGKA